MKLFFYIFLTFEILWITLDYYNDNKTYLYYYYKVNILFPKVFQNLNPPLKDRLKKEEEATSEIRYETLIKSFLFVEHNLYKDSSKANMSLI